MSDPSAHNSTALSGALLTSSALLAATLLAGCSNDAIHDSSHTDVRTLTVFAAASLTDAFTAIGRDFEAANPDTKVVFNFAGSQSLRTQLDHGASADLFASANVKHMDALVGAGLIGSHAPFVRNRMVIVTPADNPAGVTSLQDLATTERIVLAGSDVPAGAYADRVLQSAGLARTVNGNVVSRELDVRQTLQKVVLGEANAALVYATDAASAGSKVNVVEIPPGHNITAEYPIAVLTGAERAGLAQRFLGFLRSDTARARLESFGFVAAR